MKDMVEPSPDENIAIFFREFFRMAGLSAIGLLRQPGY